MEGKSEDIRKLLYNFKEPLLFRNNLKWNMLNWTLDDWCKKLDKVELKFRLGKFEKTTEPQWENTTGAVNGTFKEFLEFENRTDWLYFDYKYLKDWLDNLTEFKEDIEWKSFGFNDITYKDCTIWIGNKGAHTPCHIDTYGFNLVAQIYGRKQWLLFPPKENLLPTRVPYEESSIYSKINFFSPSYKQFEGINGCKSIILEPGDVLFVPHGWWHYVENLEVAISINTWIPLESDTTHQVEEAIVKLLMDLTIKRNNSIEANDDNLLQTYQMLNDCINHCKISIKKEQHQETFDAEPYFKDYKDTINRIQTLTKEELKLLIMKKCKQFNDQEEKEEVLKKSDDVLKKFIESVTHPDTVALIKNKLLENYFAASFPTCPTVRSDTNLH